MSNKKFSASISGKGYYIALILCAVAIGITGYLYYQSQNKEPASAEQPHLSAEVEQADIQAAATNPAGTVTPQVTQAPQPAAPARLHTVSPVAGETVSTYAVDCLSYNQTTRDWRTHDGIDIAAAVGTSVCAAADGEVYSVYEDETMGTTVVILHEGGYSTRYASLDQEVRVSAGDTVTAGQVLGCVGSTALLESAIGDHVHFSVTCNEQSIDPAEFLN